MTLISSTSNDRFLMIQLDSAPTSGFLRMQTPDGPQLRFPKRFAKVNCPSDRPSHDLSMEHRRSKTNTILHAIYPSFLLLPYLTLEGRLQTPRLSRSVEALEGQKTDFSDRVWFSIDVSKPGRNMLECQLQGTLSFVPIVAKSIMFSANNRNLYICG